MVLFIKLLQLCQKNDHRDEKLMSGFYDMTMATYSNGCWFGSSWTVLKTEIGKFEQQLKKRFFVYIFLI